MCLVSLQVSTLSQRFLLETRKQEFIKVCAECLQNNMFCSVNDNPFQKTAYSPVNHPLHKNKGLRRSQEKQLLCCYLLPSLNALKMHLV